uniref:Uncharacterized protein n=1 Tax=Arundo donax TaxID=35708 RepID=A0A0A9CCH7_ARUDO
MDGDRMKATSSATGRRAELGAQRLQARASMGAAAMV